ncbi:MAG: serine hydrolase domain-containing protein [Tsuneonella sp.]
MAFTDFGEPQVSRRALLRGGALLGAGVALGGWPAASWAEAAPGGWTNVQALIDSYVDSRKLANVVAALGWDQREPVFLAKGDLAFGTDAPAGPDSLYRIYSMTKPITGMAVMQLISEGKLGLDQPLSDILPKFAKMQVQKTYDGSITDLEPAARPITIRNLLTHTAGLGYSIIQKGPIKDAYEAAGVIPGQVTKLPAIQKIFGRGETVRSLATFADRLAELPLVYQPGTHWSYSVGLDLLGRVIEVVSGQPFDTFLQERILGPTGMSSTFFRVPASEAERLTTNYGILEGTPIPIDPPSQSVYLDEPAFPFGGAGLVSSPRDYDRFLRMLLGLGMIDGKRVLSESAVRVGTSNLLPPGVSTNGTFADGAGFGAGGRVGLGATAGTYGWGGAAGTVAFVDMRRGLRANLMTQYMPDSTYPIHAEFPVAVAKDIFTMASKKAA